MSIVETDLSTDKKLHPQETKLKKLPAPHSFLIYHSDFSSKFFLKAGFFQPKSAPWKSDSARCPSGCCVELRTGRWLKPLRGSDDIKRPVRRAHSRLIGGWKVGHFGGNKQSMSILYCFVGGIQEFRVSLSHVVVRTLQAWLKILGLKSRQESHYSALQKVEGPRKCHLTTMKLYLKLFMFGHLQPQISGLPYSSVHATSAKAVDRSSAARHKISCLGFPMRDTTAPATFDEVKRQLTPWGQRRAGVSPQHIAKSRPQRVPNQRSRLDTVQENRTKRVRTSPKMEQYNL